MLSREEYIQMSLENNLFWVRIMKEHAVFIESSITPPEKQLAVQAGRFKQQFERLLTGTIRLANGSVSRSALQSGQYYTRFTDEAERIAQQYTGIPINRNLTRQETDIVPLNPHIPVTARKEHEVSLLNQNILEQASAFVRFKSSLLGSQSSCRIFTFLYTAVLDHILREVREFIEILSAIQRRDRGVQKDERFWNHIMSDHAKTMRGLFDPTEPDLFNGADQFAKIYDALLQGERVPRTGVMPMDGAALNDTVAFSNFKAEITRGQIECKVKSLMLPLFTDHLLREANHYIYLLES